MLHVLALAISGIGTEDFRCWEELKVTAADVAEGSVIGVLPWLEFPISKSPSTVLASPRVLIVFGLPFGAYSCCSD